MVFRYLKNTGFAFVALASFGANATLVDGSVLSFSAASTSTTQPAVGAGSWWAFPDSNLYLGIESFDGLIVGTAQSASGSHNGAPDGSESPGIDKPWQAFGNTGMLETTLPASIVSASGNTTTLNFMGIAVDWAGIDAIPIYEPLVGDTGLASVVCAVDCGVGDTYILDYSGNTEFTQGGKGTVPFLIHLEGTITSVVPIPAAIWLFSAGLISLIGVARRKA